jgi:hypothetical protein
MLVEIHSGGPVIGEAFVEPVDDLGGRGSGREDPLDAGLLELGDVVLGMMPPPNTNTSPAPLSRRSLTTFGNSVMCAPEWQDRPTASASSWIVVSAICSGVWCRPV